MKTVYIAGPFSADTAEQRRRNVAEAASYITPIRAAGGDPDCPQKTTEDIDDTLSWECWMGWCLVRLSRAHAILLTPRWKESPGARIEYEFARALGLPVFEAARLGFLPRAAWEWIREKKEP